MNAQKKTMTQKYLYITGFYHQRTDSSTSRSSWWCTNRVKYSMCCSNMHKTVMLTVSTHTVEYRSETHNTDNNHARVHKNTAIVHNSSQHWMTFFLNVCQPHTAATIHVLLGLSFRVVKKYKYNTEHWKKQPTNWTLGHSESRNRMNPHSDSNENQKVKIKPRCTYKSKLNVWE